MAWKSVRAAVISIIRLTILQALLDGARVLNLEGGLLRNWSRFQSAKSKIRKTWFWWVYIPWKPLGIDMLVVRWLVVCVLDKTSVFNELAKILILNFIKIIQFDQWERQSKDLTHFFFWFICRWECLVRNSGFCKCFRPLLCNSGVDSVECGFKEG
jgi:hypothetical protein